MIEQVRPLQLSAWLANNPGAVVLDVREAWELTTASIRADGFQLVTIPMQALPARQTELNKQTPIACLCHHGARSQQVAHFLVQSGFEKVVNIAGGIHAWSLDVDPGVPTY